MNELKGQKSELKSGMRVELRCGDISIVMCNINTINYNHQVFVLCESNAFMIGGYYRDDLTHKNGLEWDIVKIYNKGGDDQLLNPFEKGELLWERNEVKEYTLQEIADKMGVDVNSIRIKD